MTSAKQQRLFAEFDDDNLEAGRENLSDQAKLDLQLESELAENGLPSSLADRTVYVVDAHALIYQVFHALPDMSGPRGQPVGAIHGFIRDMVDILSQKKPDFLFCAFDSHGDTYRHEIYPEYKAHREEMPEDLRPQIEDIRRMLRAMGVASLELPGFEADDILATLARQVEELGGRCLIVTHDKDCRQLITDNVQIYNIRKNTTFDAQALLADWGIRPDQVVDFQSLVGDSVDNVPGVPQIGPKTAKELLNEYNDLEGVLANADKVKAKKRRENLQQHGELAHISRDLVRLENDVPIEIDWLMGRVGGMDPSAVQALCQEFGFRRLAGRLRELKVRQVPDDWEGEYRAITDERSLQQLVAEIEQQEAVAIHVVPTAMLPRWSDLAGIAFAFEDSHATYVPVVADPNQDCPENWQATVLEQLRPLLESAKLVKYGSNLKAAHTVLRNRQIELKGMEFDVGVADYLLDPGERRHAADDLAARYLSHNIIVNDDCDLDKSPAQVFDATLEDVAQYAGEVADVVWRAQPILKQRLAEEKLLDLFSRLEVPLIEVLAELEFNGISVDVDKLNELGSDLADRMEKLQEQIHDTAGIDFNVDSPMQLASVLFERHELPVIKKTKTGPSTDVEVLKQLAEQTDHPLPRLIIEYRQLAKLRGTYADALPGLVFPETKRIHACFRQDVTATGRLSSSDPNLQNIPIRTEEGRKIRTAFVAREAGWRLLTADYSQIELRVLAHFSADETLRDTFFTGKDIHARVAAEVYGVSLDDVTTAQRRSAKAINFGVIYGQTPFGLAKALSIEKEEAAAFIDAYFEKYPKVDVMVNDILEGCRKDGYVKTILGRLRMVQGVRSRERRGESRFRTLPERIAVNTVIQGSAADIIKQAMVNLAHRLRASSLQARLLLQIHDELVLEAPEEELDELSEMVEQEMKQAIELSVPIVVDVGIGPNWAECK